jgi:DNA-binding LytR/AlgR family response regulator
LDESIEEISTTLSQNDYFKINRGMMIKKVSVKGFEPYFNNRLFLTVVPTHHESVIVAREKVKEFRNWLKS